MPLDELRKILQSGNAPQIVGAVVGAEALIIIAEQTIEMNKLLDEIRIAVETIALDAKAKHAAVPTTPTVSESKPKPHVTAHNPPKKG